MDFSAVAPAPSIAARESRTEGCDTHGVYQSFRVDPAIAAFCARLTGREPEEHRWTGCPECERIGRIRLEAEARRRNDEPPELLLQLSWAGVPERFRASAFDGFDASDPDPELAKKKAHALAKARSYAANFRARRETGTALLFSGRPGCGKTHLAVAILRQAIEEGWSARYTTVHAMVSAVMETWKTAARESEAMERFIQPDLLVVDEVGAQPLTPVALGKVLEIFDGRYGRRKPVVAVSNLPLLPAREGDPNPWTEALGSRVVDRLRDNGGEAVVFDWPSHRLPAARRQRPKKAEG